MATGVSVEVSAAKIAAVAALAGALIGIVGAGVPAILQIQAAQEQSSTEFLREQRQAAYSAVIAAYMELENKLDGPPVPEPPGLDELAHLMGAVDAAVSSALVVCQEDMERQLKVLSATQRVYALEQWKFENARRAGNDVSGFLQPLADRRTDLEEEFDQFMQLVRRDMGVVGN
jgi:hypothetical protein